MALTFGIGPLAKPRTGQLNVDLSGAPGHLVYVHDLGKHIRGELAGVTIVDSDGVKLLHETALPPQWYFPLTDINPEVLVPSEHTTHCPFKGDARYWHLRVGDALIENVVWNYPTPVPGAPDLAELAGFYSDRLDAWYEEDEQVTGHPRDPFHRVDVRRSSRQVTVSVHGEQVASTRAPLALFETGLPVRWYIPEADVAPDRLANSQTHTYCPYKGMASYLSYRGVGDPVEDVAWTYPDPLDEARSIAGYLSFDGDGVAVAVGPYGG
ncbi:MAG TPA: DUF427 domain-containing protein [Mycobacteriales bacterium]|jgi:uncharacterized protein (DUF427 family)|nr:DUF427 domain-containing protein [Mycobacteriales bacterium]